MITKLWTWFNIHYEKCWVVVCMIGIALLALGSLTKSTHIYDTGDDLIYYWDEVLSN